MSSQASHQAHTGAVALSEHWCAELSIDLAQFHVPTLFSPPSTAKVGLHSSERSGSCQKRKKILILQHKNHSHTKRGSGTQGWVWLKQQQQAAVKYPPREKPGGQGRKSLIQGHPPVSRPRGTILLAQQTKNPKRLKFTSQCT